VVRRKSLGVGLTVDSTRGCGLDSRQHPGLWAVQPTALGAGDTVFSPPGQAGALALRPLLSNPGVSAAVEDGLGWPTVLWLPVVAVSLLIVAARLWQLFDDDAEEPPGWGEGPDDPADTESDHWGVVDGWDEGPENDTDREPDSDDTEPVPAHTGALTAEAERPSPPSRQRPGYRILGGKGGARDRSFDLEQEPPEASLGEHLDHLQAELDEELAEFERVVAKTESESPVPDRCPQQHCNARWEERSVLGINTGRYEILDDGRVCCLECESVFDLES